MTGKLKPPTKEISRVLKAAREQNDALRDALVLSFDLDLNLGSGADVDPTLKALFKYVRRANEVICVALGIYDLMVDHAEAMAVLEEWEAER